MSFHQSIAIIAIFSISYNQYNFINQMQLLSFHHSMSIIVVSSISRSHFKQDQIDFIDINNDNSLIIQCNTIIACQISFLINNNESSFFIPWITIVKFVSIWSLWSFNAVSLNDVDAKFDFNDTYMTRSCLQHLMKYYPLQFSLWLVLWLLIHNKKT